MASRVIAQILIQVSTIATRAMAQAYGQALASTYAGCSARVVTEANALELDVLS